jgi:hypothetical protein
MIQPVARVTTNIKKPVEEKDTLIQCDRANDTTYVTIPEFYAKNNKCRHSLNKEVTFFHLGKAGGGTVAVELSSNKIGVAKSHPRPNIDRVTQLQNGTSRTLIINLRDPVDRFVSAFNWRLVRVCNGPNDTREQHKHRGAQYPETMCQISPDEDKLLRQTYKSDVSVLGEALCEGSPLREQAAKDYSSIAHSLTMKEWLDFLVDSDMIRQISNDNGIQDLFVIPMEKNKNGTSLFEKHIQQLFLHLLQSRYDEATAKSILDQKPQAKEGQLKDMAKYEHSSSKHHNTTKLTSLAECCLARHLQDDYHLISSMLGGDAGVDTVAVQPYTNIHPSIQKACSWGNTKQKELCRADLRSMLSRRARYLDLALGTCSKVTATTK